MLSKETIRAYCTWAMVVSAVMSDIADDIGIVKPKPTDVMLPTAVRDNYFPYLFFKKTDTPVKSFADTGDIKCYIDTHIFRNDSIISEVVEQDNCFYVIFKIVEKGVLL